MQIVLLLKLIKGSRQDRIFLAVPKTTTWYSLVTGFSTVPFACQRGINAVNCKKRRIKKELYYSDPLYRLGDKWFVSYLKSLYLYFRFEGDLASSINGNDQSPTSSTKRTGRLKLTLWSTLTQTFTLYSTVTNSASLFSVSFFCSVPGLNYPPVCPG